MLDEEDIDMIGPSPPSFDLPKKVKHKYMEFEYLLERKSFRLMKKYYKTQFDMFATPLKFRKNARFLSWKQLDEILKESHQKTSSYPHEQEYV